MTMERDTTLEGDERNVFWDARVEGVEVFSSSVSYTAARREARSDVSTPFSASAVATCDLSSSIDDSISAAMGEEEGRGMWEKFARAKIHEPLAKSRWCEMMLMMMMMMIMMMVMTDRG